jgi:hypothetical protein
MTGQATARINGVTADVGPAPGSAWQPARPGLPRPPEAGRFTLVTLPPDFGHGALDFRAAVL